ncbi:glycosyltransferase family 2 protein [Candidatus Micrarchaeota archaeon]|nr:glycosyltransferase family 2 protein [Candidatus Micrarchaeota archaeon]
MTGISFIVLNYNGENVLSGTLRSIEAERRPGDECIVVDNHSTDQSRSVCQRFPGVRFLSLAENRVLGAYNAGVQAAVHPWVCLLNNDIHIEKGFRDAAIRHVGDKRLFAATAKILYPDKKTMETGYCRPSFNNFHFKYDIVGRGELASQYEQEMENFSAPMAGIFHREKYLELGGIDCLYFPAYWEEIDLAYNAWKRGWCVLFDPKMVAVHHHEDRIVKTHGAGKTVAAGARNKILFVAKNIADRGLLFRFFIGWPAVFLAGTLRRGPWFAYGFFQAIPRLTNAWKRKKEMEKKRVLSDREIFHRTHGMIRP